MEDLSVLLVVKVAMNGRMMILLAFENTGKVNVVIVEKILINGISSNIMKKSKKNKQMKEDTTHEKE